MIIPPFTYLPLCSSVDPYRCILRALPKDCHAFTTKARCPALVLFELEEHPEAMDVAAFLGAELHEYEEFEIVVPSMTAEPTEIVVDKTTEDDSMPLDSLPSRFDEARVRLRVRRCFLLKQNLYMSHIFGLLLWRCGQNLNFVVNFG